MVIKHSFCSDVEVVGEHNDGDKFEDGHEDMLGSDGEVQELQCEGQGELQQVGDEVIQDDWQGELAHRLRDCQLLVLSA